MISDGRAQSPDGRGVSGGSTAGAQGSGAQPDGTGRNPYESPVTGSYPYPSQPYAEPATAGRDVYDERDYRPSAADGYGAASANGTQGGTGTGGYPDARYGNPGSGYAAPRDDRY